MKLMKLTMKRRMRNQRKRKNKWQRKMQEKDRKQMEDVANMHLFGDWHVNDSVKTARKDIATNLKVTMSVALNRGYCPTGVMSLEDNDTTSGAWECMR
jgi:hypothetical protein